MLDVSDCRLGETDRDIVLEGSADNRAAALALAEQARRSLAIFSCDLDKAIYDDGPFLDAVKQLALRSRQTQVRVLVQDSTAAVKAGHRLIQLGHRLPSSIQFRRPGAEYREYRQAFLIADGIGLLKRVVAERYEGRLNFKAVPEAKELLKFFNEVWERGETDPYLRRLDI